jgi:hypothetical protein
MHVFWSLTAFVLYCIVERTVVNGTKQLHSNRVSTVEQLPVNWPEAFGVMHLEPL